MKKLIEKAIKGESKLNQEVLDLPGMSSARVRHLLNLLCTNKKYLEVGTHKGSTLIAATYENGAKGLAYDDYRRFGNHEDEVNGLIDAFGVDAELRVEDGMNHHGREKYDVIFYDGDHSYEACAAAIQKFRKFLKKGGVMVIDDFEYEPTMQAVTDSDFDTMIPLRADSKNTKPVRWDWDGWFNGLALLTFK